MWVCGLGANHWATLCERSHTARAVCLSGCAAAQKSLTQLSETSQCQRVGDVAKNNVQIYWNFFFFYWTKSSALKREVRSSLSHTINTFHSISCGNSRSDLWWKTKNPGSRWCPHCVCVCGTTVVFFLTFRGPFHNLILDLKSSFECQDGCDVKTDD